MIETTILGSGIWIFHHYMIFDNRTHCLSCMYLSMPSIMRWAGHLRSTDRDPHFLLVLLHLRTSIPSMRKDLNRDKTMEQLGAGGPCRMNYTTDVWTGWNDILGQFRISMEDFHRANPSEQRLSPSISLLWISGPIFDHVKQSPMVSCFKQAKPNPTIISYRLSCKKWDDITLPIIYHDVSEQW